MNRQLTLARTVLRPFRDDDVELLFELHRDPELARVVPFTLHTDVEQARQLLGRIMAGNKAGTAVGWVITLESKPIGTVGLVRLDPANKQCDLAYSILREHWGSGLAREAVRGVLGFAFGALHYERVFALVDAMNVRSSRFAEKLGFNRESTFTEIFNGAERTTYRYVITAT